MICRTFYFTLAGIYLLFVMDGWEILKRWATYWQCREPEIIALMGLNSHFSIAPIPTAVPISAHCAGWFLQVPPNLHFYGSGISETTTVTVCRWVIPSSLLGCVKGTTLQPFSLSHSIQLFLRWSKAAYLLLRVISSAIFCFARFLFLIVSVFLCVASVQSNACHLHSSYLNWEHTFQACMYLNKVSKGETKC